MEPLENKHGTTGLEVPLLLSVTGHIDIHPLSHDAVKEKLEQYLTVFKKMYKDTPIYLISTLAEGGDRIAAEAAINTKIPLLAVLPMPRPRYERTFSSKGSVNEFRRLLSLSENHEPHVIDDVADQDNPDYESLQYHALGKFLISNSHVLIALWNGQHTHLVGGTSDVVRMACYGTGHNAGCDDQDGQTLKIMDRCLIYHIMTPRKGDKPEKYVKACYIKPDPIPKGLPSEHVYKEHRSNEIPEYHAKIFSRIQVMNADMFNKRGRSGRARYDKRDMITGVKEDFLNGICFGPFSAEYPEDFDICKKISNIDSANISAKKFTVADRLATKYQYKSLFNKRAYLFLITLSSILLMAYLTLYKEMIIIGLYSITLALSIFFYVYHVKIKNREAHIKFLEYRHLAEFMRIYFYSMLSVGKCSFSSMIYEYLREPTAWIRNTLKGWTSVLFADHSQLSSISDIERIKITRRTWIDDQLAYHMNKRERNRKGFAVNTSLEMVLSASAILFSITIFLISFLSINEYGEIDDVVIAMNFIVALFNIFITMIITIKDFHIHGGTPEEIDLKIRMMAVAKERFDHIDMMFISGECTESEYVQISREIFLQLSVQCMEECTDWAATHVTKYIKTLPKGPDKIIS